MPRLGSKKSRSGCIQCKARRVKCDEIRPCGNCARYNVECSLLSTPPVTSNRASPHPSRSNAASSASPAPSSATSASPHVIRPPLSQGENVTGGWMEDLELMHHYTAHSYLTMPGVETARQTWGYAVPQEAFKYRFLMHSILAFAANHLAHIHPSRSHHFHLLGSTHQTASIKGLNEEISNHEMAAINAHALFAGASLISLNAFADTDGHNLNALIDIFALLRGLHTILGTTEPLIRKGPFADIVRQIPVPSEHKPPPLLSAFLVDIQALSTGLRPLYPDDRCNAAELLREALQNGIENSTYPALRAVMTWPMNIDTEYLELLRARTDQDVVGVFRQYCRIMEYAGTEWWFLSGWRNISQQFLLHS
ncbi:hypothetical protein K458DRAFT_489906 [Lentithecium fluviatile CBS 122367]|uniref:Zn(2)-C6 fungal-type domain-containing protein n=1 Tax=Lentithecium fluviatile CBS 122367 TaxID=1168545 RepID=A0A6G1IRB0_9PLEO|nr:hypothetical protein K458DRAFT_489906 [Lentithecium fluviatile CBS 122367]